VKPGGTGRSTITLYVGPWPLRTALELVEPALPALPYPCADDVAGLAVAAGPEARSAQETIHMAQAARAAGKLDCVPSIAAAGGYVNPTAAPYVQQDIGYVGFVGTDTVVDWASAAMSSASAGAWSPWRR
jgi:hypothetical protein